MALIIVQLALGVVGLIVLTVLVVRHGEHANETVVVALGFAAASAVVFLVRYALLSRRQERIKSE